MVRRANQYRNEYEEWSPPLGQPDSDPNPWNASSRPADILIATAIFIAIVIIMKKILADRKARKQQATYREMDKISNNSNDSVSYIRYAPNMQHPKPLPTPLAFGVPPNSTILFRKSLTNEIVGFDTMDLVDTRRPPVNTQGTSTFLDEQEIQRPQLNEKPQENSHQQFGKSGSSNNFNNGLRYTTDSVATLLAPRPGGNQMRLKNSFDYNNKQYTQNINNTSIPNYENDDHESYKSKVEYVDSLWSMPTMTRPSEMETKYKNQAFPKGRGLGVRIRPGFQTYDPNPGTLFSFGDTPHAPKTNPTIYQRRTNYYGR